MYVGKVCDAVVAVMIRAPAIETRPSSLWASIVLLSAVDAVACVMAAGALFNRFSIVALLLAVLTAAFAAF